MDVLLLNGSPRRDGATATMLAALAEGLKKGGAETEIVELGRLGLHPCIGCFDCWVLTPGQCRFTDAMAALLPRYGSADLLVFGTPLYHFSMTAQLKTFVDRTLPLAEPWLVRRADGLTGHPRRVPRARPAKAMLVSPCGFPERAHFAALVATFRLLAQRCGWEWVGEILRPGAAGLTGKNLRPGPRIYLDQLVAAGVELAHGRPLPAVAAEDAGDGESYRAQANRHWAAELQSRHLPAVLPGAAL